MKTRAAVAWEPNQSLSVEEIDIEGPKSGEVLVRMVATGVCHTDAFTLSGEDPEGVFPCILGHEGAGIVEEIGPNVSSVKPGDSVIPLYIPECQKCSHCLSGKTNLCLALNDTEWSGLMPDGTTRFSKNNKKIYHYMGTSTFSEYSIVPEIALAKINSKAPLEQVCLFGCGITTGIGAVIHTAKVKPGSSVAVFGLGGIGLSVIQGLVMAKAARIIAIDVNEGKFDLAEKLGATDLINPKKYNLPIQEVIEEITKGGVDYSFECVGNVELMRSALECCHMGWGESIIIGVAGAGKLIQTRPYQLITGRVWRGSAFGGIRGRTDLPGFVEKYLHGEIEIDKLITHRMSLENINHAFKLMLCGDSIRSVIHYHPTNDLLKAEIKRNEP